MTKAQLLNLAAAYFDSSARMDHLCAWIVLFEWAGMYD